MHRSFLRYRRRLLLGGLASGVLPGLGACRAPQGPPLRVGAQPWPGFELMYLARQRGYLPAERVRLIESPSASASLRSLGAQAIEGAGLTLDEVLTARSRGMDLRVVAVLDVSRGADVVMTRPDIDSVRALVGRRVGVEPSATGAVMLDAMLSRHGLEVHDVRVLPLHVDEHLGAYRSQQVDAVVTYEPVKSQLLRLGAKVLFSSAEVPGRIVDTLAFRPEALDEHGDEVRALLAGHFRALTDWQREPATCTAQLAPRLGLGPDEVPATFAELDFPDAPANRAWLGTGAGAGSLMTSARHLLAVMRAAQLLPGELTLDRLADDRFLPEAAP